MKDPQPVAHGNSRRDPPDRSPEADLGEVPVPVGHVVEAERVGQRDRRGVDQPVNDRECQEGGEGLHAREEPDQCPAEQVA